MDDRYQLKPRLHRFVKHRLALSVIPQGNDQTFHALRQQRAELVSSSKHLLPPPSGPMELSARVQQTDHRIAPRPFQNVQDDLGVASGSEDHDFMLPGHVQECLLVTKSSFTPSGP